MNEATEALAVAETCLVNADKVITGSGKDLGEVCIALGIFAIAMDEIDYSFSRRGQTRVSVVSNSTFIAVLN